MLNVRLNKGMEEKLKRYSDINDLSKTDIVKEALALYFKRHDLDTNPYVLGKDLFGEAGSQRSDNSVTYKSRLKKKLGEKHAH